MSVLVFRILAALIVVAEIVAFMMWAQDGFQPRSLDMIGAMVGILLITPPTILYAVRGPEGANALLGRLIRLSEKPGEIIDAALSQFVEMPEELREPDSAGAGEGAPSRTRPIMATRRETRFLAMGLGLGLLAAAAHLGWEATHGGIRSHHLLARADLPAVSNGWGLLVLPLLGGLAAWSVAVRARDHDGLPPGVVAAFVGSLLVGAALSASFAAGSESVVSGLLYAVLLTGLFLPIYRPEYVFGFVLGMTYVFGAVMPLIPVTMAAGLSAAAHFLVRPAIARLRDRSRRRAERP